MDANALFKVAGAVRCWACYVAAAVVLSMVIRVIAAALKAMERKTGNRFARDFWANIRGYSNEERMTDYWYPFVIGVLEFLAYPLLFLAGGWTLIGGWLAFKTLAQWKHWSEDRPGFNRFLIGNGLVILGSFFVAWKLR